MRTLLLVETTTDEMTTLGLLGAALARLGLVLVLLVMSVGLVVAFRRVSRSPTELDRIGSDLNLYGYGIVLSLAFSLTLGRPILSWMPAQVKPLIVLFFGLVSLLTYLANLLISERLRTLMSSSSGIDTFTQLVSASSGNKTIRRCLFWSFVAGVLPTLIIVVLDLVPL